MISPRVPVLRACFAAHGEVEGRKVRQFRANGPHAVEPARVFTYKHAVARNFGSPEWIERMRTEPVLEVAQGLGIEVQPARGSSGGAFGCPACNAPRRHTRTRDKRGAAGVRRDGKGWKCFQCDASGDGIDLVAFYLRGKALSDLADAGKAEVRDWCVRWLRLETFTHTARHAPVQRRTRSEPIPPTPPSYPPLEEVEALWAATKRVDSDDLVAAWLREKRGIDPGIVAELNLVRALPPAIAPLPSWAGYGGSDNKPWRSWPSAGLRLLVPLYDATGVMRSVLFRRTFEAAEAWQPKSVATNGYGRAGLVMANAVACHLLAHALDNASAASVVIEEGEMDWLTGCFAWARKNERAIFGVMSGSWTPQIAQCIPRGSRVTIRTDNDKPGDIMATEIAKTLQDKCTVLRGGRRAG